MSLEDIVNVNVTISASTIAEAGFSTPLIFAHHNHFGDLVRTYKTSTFQTAMVADGFVATEAAYQAAVSLAKQSPVSGEFKVGKRSTADIQIVRLIPNPIANLTIYAVTIDKPGGTTVTASFTSDATATLAEICTGLSAAINTATGLTTANGAGGTYVELTGAADLQYSYYNLTNNLVLTDVSVSGGTLAADLSAIKAYDNDWYGLILASSAPDAIEEVADWVETDKSKLFVANTHDMKVFDTATYPANIFKSIKDQSYARTHVTYNSRAGSYYGGAWLATIITYEPGQADWMFKTLPGIYGEKLTDTNAGKLAAQYGSYYSTVYRGKVITGAAQGGNGTFLDLVQLSDWIRSRTVEAILVMLTSSPKVAHTDQGAGNAIWGALKGVIDRAIANEAIAAEPQSWRIVVPKRSSLSAADRSAYRWPGNAMSVTPTGAVHSVGTINITLNVA